MKFVVDLDLIGGVTPEELAQAIKDAVTTLALRNGDTLYLEDSAISIKSTD